jgi:hypothetical protein
MIRALFIIQSAFSAWMFWDAVRRRAETYWYFIIMMPFGEVVYFFLVKIHDPELYQLRKLFTFSFFTEKVSVDKLRYEFRQTPSFANMIRLAQALHDRGEYQEAAELFEQALKLDDGSKDVLHGLALARTGLDEYETAVGHLRRIVDDDPQYKGYTAWASLAYALWMAGRPEEAVESLAELVRISPRMSHRLLYAEYLIEAGRHDAAGDQIGIAIEDYTHAPSFQKRKDRHCYKRAKKLLKHLRST